MTCVGPDRRRPKTFGGSAITVISTLPPSQRPWGYAPLLRAITATCASVRFKAVVTPAAAIQVANELVDRKQPITELTPTMAALIMALTSRTATAHPRKSPSDQPQLFA